MVYKSTKHITNPIASVFIFTYNQENMVGNTIESVLAQKTTFPMEIVIVDDSSKDKTKNKCLEFFEKYPEKIIVVVNEQNKGIVRNYYESIYQNTQGKYIAIVAGDDWWIDDYKMQKQVDFLEKNSSYDLVYTKSKVYIQKTGKYSRKLMGENRTTFEQMIVANGISALTVCYTRKAFCEFVSEMDPINLGVPSDDYAKWIWFTYRKKIYFMDNEVTTVYRLQNESASNTQSWEKRFQIETDRINIRMVFYRYFNISNERLFRDMWLRYYIDTMRIVPFIHDDKIKHNSSKLFLDNGLIILYLLSQLYNFFGTNTRLNSLVYFIQRVCRKMRISEERRVLK